MGGTNGALEACPVAGGLGPVPAVAGDGLLAVVAAVGAGATAGACAWWAVPGLSRDDQMNCACARCKSNATKYAQTMCKSNVLDKLAIGASAAGVSLPVICSLVFLDRSGDLVTGVCGDMR
jgi:hypothetical protein